MPGLLTPANYIGLDVGIYPHTMGSAQHQKIESPISAVAFAIATEEVQIKKEG